MPLAARHHSSRGDAPAPGGFTLAELVVALAVGGVTFGAFALVVAREERTHADLTRRMRAHAQTREGVAALAADLRPMSPAAGDIPAGGARDSSIELRWTVGTAVVCELRGGALVTGLASFVRPPEAGDTVWAYVERESGGVWTPILAVGAQDAPAEAVTCPFPATATEALEQKTPRPMRYTLLLAGGGDSLAAMLARGRPLRVTRRVRYSLYRAPDGRWYLGRREWTASGARFESIQPVSGPYRPYAPVDRRSSGMQLEYFDTEGAPVASGAGETDRIARVVVTLRGSASMPEGDLRRPDGSAAVSIAFRNRP